MQVRDELNVGIGREESAQVWVVDPTIHVHQAHAWDGFVSGVLAMAGLQIQRGGGLRTVRVAPRAPHVVAIHRRVGTARCPNNLAVFVRACGHRPKVVEMLVAHRRLGRGATHAQRKRIAAMR